MAAGGIGIFLMSAATAPLSAQDTFQADEVIVQKVTPKPEGDARRTLKFDVDETRVIYEEPISDRPQWYFYLPPEANSVVRLIIQKQDDRLLFILKGVGRGKTVGGFVHRGWLDDSGLAPNSALDETLIQQAVKSSPVFILVD
jgi:hypothetical protein